MVWWAVLLAGPGCFKESDSVDTSGTSGGCPPGSPGCPCYGNGTCDPNLDCTPEGVCIEPGCTPGEENCTCNDGQCLTGLACGPDDVCHAGGGTSTTGGTGGDLCVPQMTDDDCAVCSKQACCEPYTQCTMDPTCDCVSSCIAQGPACDLEAQCDVTGPPPLLVQLVGCVTDACPICIPNCNPEGDQATACRVCTSQNCCGALDACLDTEACGCLVTCMDQGMDFGTCLAMCPQAETPELTALQECAMQNQCESDTGLCYQP